MGHMHRKQHLENISFANSYAFKLLYDKTFLKNFLAVRPEKRKKKKKLEWQLQNFCIKRNHKNLNENSMAQSAIKSVSGILEKIAICGKKV